MAINQPVEPKKTKPIQSMSLQLRSGQALSVVEWANFVRVSDGFVIACIVTEESRAFPVAGNFV